MRVRFLIHDAAMKVAIDSLAIIAPFIDDEQKLDVFVKLYEAAKTAIEEHETRADRMVRRVKP